MGKNTGISWCQHTQNFWKGCKMVSPGCKNCYMFREMNRFGLNPEEITRTKTWRNPKRWNKEAQEEKKSRLVFTCSWSDFFIEESDAWRKDAWKIIKETPWLQWQILTKRIKRVIDHLPEDWGTGYPNVWIGTSIENSNYNWRADELRKVPARVRFISAEPLLASMEGLNLENIHWLIAGGESGPDHRPMNIEWVKELRDMCNKAKTAFYYKQEANLYPSKNPPLLDGRTWEEYPEIWTPEENTMKENEIVEDGNNDYWEGILKEKCPYNDSELSKLWLKGWDSGLKEFMDSCDEMMKRDFSSYRSQL